MILDLSTLFGIKPKIISEKPPNSTVDVVLPVSRHPSDGARRGLLERMVLGWC
jgi:hypothetical protein